MEVVPEQVALRVIVSFFKTFPILPKFSLMNKLNSYIQGKNNSKKGKKKQSLRDLEFRTTRILQRWRGS